MNIREQAMSIATGMNAGLSSIKGSDIFDLMHHSGLNAYLMYEDIYLLHELATNPKYTIVSNKDKFSVYDQILNPRGFIRSHSGTNRVIYRHSTDPTFILKIGLDSIGINDNKYEYYNQRVLKPFIPKVFEISNDGTVGLMERVEPILNKETFLKYANDIFSIITYLVEQGYLLEDVGTDFFMNWGVRIGFGPVLLDFPYVYRANKSRLKCIARDLDGNQCTGNIIYDDGYNFLVCNKCGKRYAAKDIGSSFRYLNEIRSKMKRREETMNYVIHASNGNEKFTIQNSSNVITDSETARNIISKLDRPQINVSRGESKDTIPNTQKKITPFIKEEKGDKFVKSNNSRIEIILNDAGFNINNIPADLLEYIEADMVINATKFIKISHFLARKSEVDKLKEKGILEKQEEFIKKRLHTNRLRVIENELFVHYYSPNAFYDTLALEEIIKQSISNYKEMKVQEEMDANKIEIEEEKVETKPEEKKIEKVVTEEPKKEIEMKFNNNALGSQVISSATAVPDVAIQSKPTKSNVASEY